MTPNAAPLQTMTAAPMRPPSFPEDAPLLRLSGQDTLTIRDAFEGIHIFGGLGSGKTSGSGQTLAHAFLRWGFGGLVLVAKTDEVQTWLRYAEATGRSASVLQFGPGHGEHFNFVQYEMRRPGAGSGIASNLINLFEQVLETQNPGKVVGGDPYWRQARAQLMRNAVELVFMATGELDFDQVAAVIRTAPLTRAETKDPTWRSRSVCARMLQAAFDRVESTQNPQDARSLSLISAYFQEEFAGLDPEPRSSIVSMVGALTDQLLRGHLHTLFMTRTTFVPELLYSGTIIILDMSVHEYNEAGKFAQVLFKTVVQRMLERRTDKHLGDQARPVFIWADEAQFFATPHDTMFQTTARSSRVATVYMTQNLPNYYDAFGADSGGRDRAKKLLGAFGIKIFHANGDLETNEYAERLFGKHHVWRESHGTNESETWSRSSSSGSGGGSTSNSHSRTLGSSQNWTQVLESQYQSKVLTELRRGGKEHKYTDALMFRAGDVWKSTGTNVLPVRFRQYPIDAIASLPKEFA